MFKTIYPKTKRELVEALNATNIIKLEVFDAGDSRITSQLRQQVASNTRRTVIIIDERI